MIDTQLVDQYVAARDPSAFRALVVRHGPAVHRTCRELLQHDPHAAEDAFQATFLILVRRAPSIRDPERLGRWLVGVARKVASRSRRRAAQLADRERRWAATHPESVEPEPPLFEVQRVVREELDRLPDTYRQPLALCYLEGLTHEQAARRLGWPVGTVKVRLVRARGKLRERLDRRGLALGVAFLLMLSRKSAEAGLSTTQTLATVDAMNLMASGNRAGLEANFPGAVSILEPSRIWSGVVAHWRLLLLLVAFVAVSTGGVAVARQVKFSRQSAYAASLRLARLLEAGCR